MPISLLWFPFSNAFAVCFAWYIRADILASFSKLNVLDRSPDKSLSQVMGVLQGQRRARTATTLLG
jgi:hypothetical protein